MLKGQMRRRPGVSLVMVLVFSLVATLVVSGMFALVYWAQDSAAAGRQRFGDRARLSSLAETARHWLRAELDAGRLPRAREGDPPVSFSEVRLLRYMGEGGALVDVYDLDYDSAGVPTEGWLRSSGPESFFPPRPGAYLIRAFKPMDSGPAMVLEIVVAIQEVEFPDGRRTFALERKPLLWQEIWF